MRKTYRIQLALLALLLGACFMLSAQELTASISKITGKVEVETENGWVPAKTGQIIKAGTSISTGFRSTAELTLGSSIVTVKALTRLTLAELAESAGVITTNLNLRVGKVSAEVKAVAGKANEFKVKSPISTASVRGTGFDFDGESLQVTHGTVDFADKMGNVVQVPIGESVRTAPSGAGGVVENKTIMNEVTSTVADSAASFGNTEASAFVEPTSNVTAIDDFSDVIDVATIVDTYTATYASKGKLVITIH
jgi:hypothetical protein